MSRTKIVATIGPVTNTREKLLALRDAGMDMARLNGSHADLDWHKDTINLIRETLPMVPILLDIPGKKIRTIQLMHEPSFEIGETVILTTDIDHDGSEKVPVNNPTLHENLKTDDVILADDGTLRFTVSDVVGRDIHCRAETMGTLRSRKGINVPYVKLPAELVTDRDRQMMVFAAENRVDFVGISFVESADHIKAIRSLISGGSPRIVAKIENQPGMENMDQILEETDAAMIDRGDLSVETNLENLVVSQKKIIERAHRWGKPVIVATEMLHTMIENPFPTKAEVSDITNAVVDGCAATMLSGETAVGKFPYETVSLMRNVLTAAEAHTQETFDNNSTSGKADVAYVMEDAAAMICRSLPVTKIIAVTLTGFAARVMSSRRPRQPILAVTSDEMASRSFNLLSGVEGIYLDVVFSRDSTDHIPACLKELWRRGKIDSDDLIMVVAVGYPKPGNVLNLIETHYVRDLSQSLKWKKSD